MQKSHQQIDPGEILQVPFKPYYWLFAKFTSLQILTHLITKYAELEDKDIQEFDRKLKEPISGETLFEEFVEKLSGIKKK